MGKNAFAALLGICALGFVVFMFNRTFGGTNIEKLTPKTTAFECVNPKCKFHADYALGEGPSHADPDVKLFQGDVYWKCIKCDQPSFHTAPMTSEAQTKPVD